jgi:hypothetical protein
MSGELTDSGLTSAEVDGMQATKVAVGCPFGMPEYQVQVGSGLSCAYNSETAGPREVRCEYRRGRKSNHHSVSLSTD